MAWRLSEFTEIGRLGAGATGRVVSARHDDTGTVVAIKYLSDELRETPGFLERFRGEARVLVDVDNPNIARLYEYVETESGAAIVMELVDGVSLYEMIRQCGATEPEAALYVLRGSLLGLAAAHQVGVVHRDYKPENVLIDDHGISKLVDFGIAARAGQQSPAPGTPLYMAPEQWLGAPATPRSDVYAATATFYECLTTHPPFHPGGGLIGLRRAHESQPVPLQAVPPEVRELLARGLAKDPGQRPPDAAAFLQDLERVAAAGYGPDWAEIGRSKLVRTIAPLLLLLGAGNAGRGVQNSVTKFFGNAVTTRALSAAALILVLVGGVSVIVSGRTNAAQISAEPSPSFVASLPAPGQPTLAPTAPGTHTTAAPTTPPGTTAGPGTTPAHNPPPGTHTTHPGTTPSSTKQSPPPSSSSPPPPTQTTITNVAVTITTGQDTMSWTVDVTTADTLPGSVTITAFTDTVNPPFNSPFGTPTDETLGGQTSYEFTGTVTFTDDACDTGAQVFYGVQAATTPTWSGNPAGQSMQETCPPPQIQSSSADPTPG